VPAKGNEGFWRGRGGYRGLPIEKIYCGKKDKMRGKKQNERGVSMSGGNERNN